MSFKVDRGEGSVYNVKLVDKGEVGYVFKVVFVDVFIIFVNYDEVLLVGVYEGVEEEEEKDEILLGEFVFFVSRFFFGSNSSSSSSNCCWERFNNFGGRDKIRGVFVFFGGIVS